jgi:hypothetical protein
VILAGLSSIVLVFFGTSRSVGEPAPEDAENLETNDDDDDEYHCFYDKNKPIWLEV